jgi:hypothetical protein
LSHRSHFRSLRPGGLDPASSRDLLKSFGVVGTEAELDEAIAACQAHPKAVELLGVYLARYRAGSVGAWRDLPTIADGGGASPEELGVLRVLSALDAVLDLPSKDILALATAFRDPPTEQGLIEYLLSPSVQALVAGPWKRTYPTYEARGSEWIKAQIQLLIDHRLLERVGTGDADLALARLDAHPLVRRAFDHSAGEAGRSASALARAGFLRGRPDRKVAGDLSQARPEIELFHAYSDAGLWEEADAAFAALQNPKYRFLAPALERDLLLRFFPEGDWKRSPLWSGFARFRSLAICFELLADFRSALDCYRGADLPLRGDALLAVGNLAELLSVRQVPAPWSNLWQAYRAHALCLVGRESEALQTCSSFLPVDVYEWLHVFEAQLRCGTLGRSDLTSILQLGLERAEHEWSRLAWQRMTIDYSRRTQAKVDELEPRLRALINAYDTAGLPWERCLARLSLARLLGSQERHEEALEIVNAIETLARQSRFPVLLRDALTLKVEMASALGQLASANEAQMEVERIEAVTGCCGPVRP